MDFTDFFRTANGDRTAFAYQQRLALEPWPDVLTVPTGLGKTAAVVLAWLWKRGWRPQGQRVAPDPATPRRLVYCLPMRVLVEQTDSACRTWTEALGCAGDSGTPTAVPVHMLMGGSDAIDRPVWAEHPEQDQILIGTQDMLLSRALMRGWGMSRYLWPVHFAMLHNDAFWVFDEVQAMGPGLVTGVQLDAFRRSLECGLQSRTLWMSATLNAQWMQTVDFDPNVLTCHALAAADAVLPAVRQRRDANKSLQRGAPRCDGNNRQAVDAYLGALAEEIVAAHAAGSITLAIVNTVDRAQGLLAALDKRLAAARRRGPVPDLLLVHSRFRAAERRLQNQTLMSGVDASGPGRVIVATQAVEAGVDLSARLLYTELAPWASLVQRFGRCNRYGERNQQADARVVWLDIADTRPYAADDLAAARSTLDALRSASPAALPAVTTPAPLVPVLRRKDLLELFNTDADLSGLDIDISQYIRDSDDADMLLFWRDWSDDPDAEQQPPAGREELCRAGIDAARALTKRAGVERGDVRIWDTLQRRWTALPPSLRLHPGMTLMVRGRCGGYGMRSGLQIDSRTAVPSALPAAAAAREAYDDEHRSLLGVAVTLPRHLCDVGAEAAALAAALGVVQHGAALVRAARWHDVGKAHEAFQFMLRDAQARAGAAALDTTRQWAKSGGNFRGFARYHVTGEARPRRHFRHELASALAWLEMNGDASEADLIAYLIAAHHGKVRMSLRALPGETEAPPGVLYARGIWHGDALPAVTIDADEAVPALTLRLSLMQLGDGAQGASWTARTQRLLAEHGPFRLAWLESLVRIADWRASRSEQA